MLRPCTERPSIHSVASLWVTHSRSTRSPSHSGGTVASSLNQNVVHERPELLAEGGVAIGERLGVGDGDAADWARHLEASGVAAVGVDQRFDPLADLRDAAAGVLGLADHARAA